MLWDCRGYRQRGFLRSVGGLEVTSEIQLRRTVDRREVGQTLSEIREPLRCELLLLLLLL